MAFQSKFEFTPEIWKAGLRTAAAAGIAYGLAEALSLQQGYWAVITSIVIMQANLGASLQAAADRFLGTLAGAALGFIAAYLTPSTSIGTLLALIIATALLSMLAVRYPSFRIAQVTAAILLISAPSHADALLSALHRVMEISLGCFIGIAVSLLIAPSRAETRLRKEASHALELLAKLFSAEMESLEGRNSDADIAEISEQIYEAYGNIDKLTKEAQEEYISHLAHYEFDLSGLARSLSHLRTSVFYIRHLTRTAWPPTLSDVLAGPVRTITTVTDDYLLSLGRTLVAGEAPPALDEWDSAFATFVTAASTAGHSQAEAAHSSDADENQRAAGNHAIAFISAFSFALKQVRLSIEELAECVKEMSGTVNQS